MSERHRRKYARKLLRDYELAPELAEITIGEWAEVRKRHRLLDAGLSLEQAELRILTDAQERDRRNPHYQEPQLFGRHVMSLDWPLGDRPGSATLADLLDPGAVRARW